MYLIQVKQQLENLYTGQYDPSKRKKKQRQFDKVWAWNVLVRSENLDAVLNNVCFLEPLKFYKNFQPWWVNKQTSNLTSLKFDQMRIADGLIPENIQVNHNILLFNLNLLQILNSNVEKFIFKSDCLGLLSVDWFLGMVVNHSG